MRAHARHGVCDGSHAQGLINHMPALRTGCWLTVGRALTPLLLTPCLGAGQGKNGVAHSSEGAHKLS